MSGITSDTFVKSGSVFLIRQQFQFRFWILKNDCVHAHIKYWNVSDFFLRYRICKDESCTVFCPNIDPPLISSDRWHILCSGCIFMNFAFGNPRRSILARPEFLLLDWFVLILCLVYLQAATFQHFSVSIFQETGNFMTLIGINGQKHGMLAAVWPCAMGKYFFQ